MSHLYKLVFFLSMLSLLALGCSTREELEIEENYKELFPFGGISKPETSFEDMAHLPCDPHQALSVYKYPGVAISEDALEYIVTLRCRYTLPDGTSSASYVLRYINEEQELTEVRSDSKSPRGEYLRAGEEFVKTFRVRSGYPLYIGLTGVAPRGSSVSASISARSTEGFVVVPKLSTEQSQNREGPNPIPNPYCEYIILP